MKMKSVATLLFYVARKDGLMDEREHNGYNSLFDLSWNL
jgi:hypothetical protein